MHDLILIALKEEAPELSFSMKVFYTGVGKVNAAMTAAECIAKYNPKRVINFGTAGGVTVKSGFHQVTKFVQRDMMCCELGSLPGQTPFEDTIIKGFEDNIIKPATDIVNNFQFPVLGGNKQPTKPPRRNTTNNDDNYIYIGAALIAAFIIYFKNIVYFIL